LHGREKESRSDSVWCEWADDLWEAIVTNNKSWNHIRQKLTRAMIFTFAAALFLSMTGTMVRASGFYGAPDDPQDKDQDDKHSYAIGLWGDLPYSDVQAQTGVPNMIAEMNSQDLEFVAHDGDLKAGNSTKGSVTPTTCSDDLYVQGLNYFNSLRAPAVFTPGDNDRTDCDRASNGGFNSRVRLDHERKLFFSTPHTLG
jgi:hypothetical protein